MVRSLLILAFCLFLPLSAASAHTACPSPSPSPAVQPWTVRLVSLVPFETPSITIHAHESPALPMLLQGATDTGAHAVLALDWPAIEFAQPGHYLLSPSLPYGYSLAESAVLPTVTVTVLPAVDPTLTLDGLVYRPESDGSLTLTGSLSPLSGTLTVPYLVAADDGTVRPVRRLQASAFRGSKLSGVELPHSLATLGEGAFQNCTSLLRVSLSPGLSRIPRTAFAGCRSLSRITLPAGVTRIDAGAFENCTSLAHVIIRGTVASVGANAFAGCSSALSFTVYEENTLQALLRYGIPQERIRRIP